MRFVVDHRFAAPVDAVEAAMLDPAFVGTLDLPHLRTPVVVDRHDDGSIAVLAMRVEFSGRVPSLARRIAGTDRISWVQTYRIDRARHEGEMTFVPDVRAERLDCRATVRLSVDGRGCRRVIDGEARVHVPLVAGRAERLVVSGLTERFDVEAEQLGHWLTGTRE